MNGTNWSLADSSFFSGAAIAAYCPQYKYVVDLEHIWVTAHGGQNDTPVCSGYLCPTS